MVDKRSHPTEHFNDAASTPSTFVNFVHVNTPTFNPAAVQHSPPNPTPDVFRLPDELEEKSSRFRELMLSLKGAFKQLKWRNGPRVSFRAFRRWNLSLALIPLKGFHFYLDRRAIGIKASQALGHHQSGNEREERTSLKEKR